MTEKEKNDFIDSMIKVTYCSDSDALVRLEMRLKRTAYSIFFGSKRLKALGINIEDAYDFREKNKWPTISGKHRLIKNYNTLK